MSVDFQKFMISVLLVGTFIAIDLWTKHEIWSVSDLPRTYAFAGTEITLTDPVRNHGGPGIFSSDFPEKRFHYWHIFVVVMSLVCFTTSVLFNERLWHSAVAAVPAGGIGGNASELMMYGSATDFIMFSGLGPFSGFVYNVADIFIMIGLPVYLLTSIMAPFSKMIAVIIHVAVSGLILGALPADPAVYMAIGCLFILLFWPDTEDAEYETE